MLIRAESDRHRHIHSTFASIAVADLDASTLPFVPRFQSFWYRLQADFKGEWQEFTTSGTPLFILNSAVEEGKQTYVG